MPAPGARPATSKLDGEPTDEEPHLQDYDTLRRWQKDEDVDPES